MLDAYEDYYGPGHPDNDYNRVWMKDLDGRREGWTYVSESSRGYPLIGSGSWVRHLASRQTIPKYKERSIMSRGKMILLTADTMGQGDRALGEQLLETFLTLLKQREELPKAVFCLNRGVLALTEQSFASVHLKELADKGVPVLACKTCVDYYGIGGQLYAGEISSMGRFLELSEEYEVMTIG